VSAATSKQRASDVFFYLGRKRGSVTKRREKRRIPAVFMGTAEEALLSPEFVSDIKGFPLRQAGQIASSPVVQWDENFAVVLLLRCEQEMTNHTEFARLMLPPEASATAVRNLANRLDYWAKKLDFYLPGVKAPEEVVGQQQRLDDFSGLQDAVEEARKIDPSVSEEIDRLIAREHDKRLENGKHRLPFALALTVSSKLLGVIKRSLDAWHRRKGTTERERTED
jgi:hypothetical protein